MRGLCGPDIKAPVSSAISVVVLLDYNLTHASAAGFIYPSIKDWPQVPSSSENVGNVVDAMKNSILEVVQIMEHTAQKDH